MSKPNWVNTSPNSGNSNGFIQVTDNGSFDVIAAKNTGVARNGIITVAGGGK